MPTTASTGLITALTTSLADETAGWTVKRVTEDKGVSAVTGSTSGTIAAVSGTITGGDGSVTGGGGSVTGSTSSTTAVRTIVELFAPSLRSGVGSRTPLSLTYISVAVGGSFSEAFIRCNGAEFRSTDGDLDDDVLALVATFLAAQDTALTAAINAGAQDDDGTELSAAMLSALTTSLGTQSHGWYCRSRVETPVHGGMQMTVALASRATKYAPTTGLRAVPAQLVYIADISAAGSLVAARLMFSGAEWKSRDASLHAAVLALAEAYTAAQDTAITAALAAGPVG